MRSFMVLCLIALATADKLGYNYQPVGHGDSSFGRGESVLSGQIGGGFGGVGAASNQAGSFAAGGNSGSFGSQVGSFGAGGDSGSFGGLGAASNQGGSFGAGGDSGSFGGLGAASNQGGSFSAGGNFGGAADGGLDKEFYTFSADEGEFDQPEASEQIANSLKQNLQVVFIKGPENRGLENAALNLAKHAGEQRTAIYVLNKQADIGDLANKLNAQNSHNRQKPEVHFVKYRTQEDAQHAQHAIQAQYDQLGGSSQNHNGGVAPVLNFASPSTQVQAGGHQGAATAPGATYLPANFVRL